MAKARTELLSLASYDRIPRDLRPLVDPRELSTGLVHLGIGAFHRAHQAIYTEAACQKSGERQWGILGASERSAAAAEVLAAQDGLYSLLVVSPTASSVRVAGPVRQTLFAKADPSSLVNHIADPAVKVVTLTVTEKGYRHNPATRMLAKDTQLEADAAGRPPGTVVGQLARGLEARRRANGAPLTVISCDNIVANGALLRSLVDELVRLPMARYDRGLSEWAQESVRFPSTMVDRIVPATTDEWRTEASRAVGLVDRAAVVTEPFSQWVIEDLFAAERPAWELAGAELVPDVAPYEALKIRALNGAHSALAYLGLLAGDQTVDQAMSRAHFEAFTRAMLVQEVQPTLVLPAGADFTSYVESALDRFANPKLPYRCLQVATDGSQKLSQRIFGTVRDLLRSGRAVAYTPLVVAAWLRAVWKSTDDLGRSFELEDPFSLPLLEAIGGTEQPSLVVERALTVREIFPDDIAEDVRFREALKAALAELSDGGAEGAVTSLAGRDGPPAP